MYLFQLYDALVVSFTLLIRLFGYTNVKWLYILHRSLEMLLHQVKRDCKVHT